MARDFLNSPTKRTGDDREPVTSTNIAPDKRALDTTIYNTSSNPVPVEIVDGSFSDDGFFVDFSDEVTGAGPHTLMDFTVAANTTRYLSYLKIACEFPTETLVTKDSTVIGTLKTGPGQPTDFIEWTIKRPILTGENLKVVLTKGNGYPDVDVGAHLMGTEKST